MSPVRSAPLMWGSGLLGSALVISGFFLPLRFVRTTFPPQPASLTADSYWSMLFPTMTGGGHLETLEYLLIGAFLLAVFLPGLSTLLGLFDTWQRVLLPLSLVFAVLGFLEFLVSSVFLLSFRWPRDAAHFAGPGFWLMLLGFPLTIIWSTFSFLWHFDPSTSSRSSSKPTMSRE